MTILCVDDDVDDLEIFIQALQGIDPDIKVLVSQNAKEALMTIGKIELPAMIFVDDQMPLMSGEEFIGELRSRNITVPIVIFSSHLTQQRIKEYRDLEVKYFLEKPNTFEEVRKRLTNLLKDILL